MDFTRESNIIAGTLKKLKLNLSRVEGPRTEQELQGTERKVTYTVRSQMDRKNFTTYGLHIST